MTEPFVIRASSTSSWADCPRRGGARVFGGLVRAMGYTLRYPPSSVGAAVGSGVHAGAKALLDEKLRTGALPEIGMAADAAVGVLRERAKTEGVLLDRETPTMNHAERQVVRMTNAYLVTTAPAVNPVMVETRLEARIPWTRQPMVLSGQADMIAREPGRIRDLKTGKARSNHRPQLGSYGLLARTHASGGDIAGAVEDFVPRTPLSRDQERPASYEHDLSGCEKAAVAVLKHMDLCLTTFIEGDEARGILPGDPWAFPANPASKLCSDKYCPAWGTEFCHEYDRGRE